MDLASKRWIEKLRKHILSNTYRGSRSTSSVSKQSYDKKVNINCNIPQSSAFDPFIRVGNRAPLILSSVFISTVSLSVPIYRHAIAYILLIEDKHCT